MNFDAPSDGPSFVEESMVNMTKETDFTTSKIELSVYTDKKVAEMIKSKQKHLDLAHAHYLYWSCKFNYTGLVIKLLKKTKFSPFLTLPAFG